MWIQTLVAAMMVLVALECCLGVEHDLGHWEPGREAEYMFWSADRTFHPHDTLKFTYPAGVHNVLELSSEADYLNCRVIDPIETYTEANAVVTLPTTGKYYYVCGVPGHCHAGMRLTVNVVPAPPSSQTPAPPLDTDDPLPSPYSGHPPAPPLDSDDPHPPPYSGHPPAPPSDSDDLPSDSADPPSNSDSPPSNTPAPPSNSAAPANSSLPPPNSRANSTATPPAPASGAVSLSSIRFSYIMFVVALVFNYAAY